MPDDVVLSIGADPTALNNTIAGLAQNIIGGLGSISPVVAGVIGVIGGIGVAAFQVGQDFDAAYDTIRVGTGATGEALEGLKADFEAVFTSVPDDAALVSTAIADVNTKLGASGPIAQALSTQFLNLARINKEDLAASIDSTSAAFNAWGVETDDQSGKLDFLFRVSQSTGVSVTDLSDKTADAASTAKNLGLSFNETAVLIGNLEKTTGDSQAAMAGLTKAVGELTEAGIPARDALGQIIGEIQNAPTDTDAAGLAMEIFGRRAGTDLAEQIRSGKFSIDELLTTLEGSPETINGVTAETQDFGEKLDILWNKVSAGLAPLGLFLVDGLTAISTFLVDNFNPALEFLGELWGGLVAFMQPVTDMLSNSLGPILQDVGAFVLGLAAAIAEQLSPAVSAVWEFMKGYATFLRDVFVFVWDAVSAAISTFIGWLKQIPGVSSLIERGQKLVKDSLDNTATAADNASGKVETHTGRLNTSREAQDKIGGANGSAPRLSSAIRDMGKAHDEAKEKIETFDTKIDDLNREFEDAERLAGLVTGQTGALQTAFENVEQPTIDMGDAVYYVDTSVQDMIGSMANADVKGKLDTWKADADAKLPLVKGSFTAWANDVTGIIGGLSTGLTTKLFTDPGSFGTEALGKLKSIGTSFLETFDTNLFGENGVITGFINKGIGALMGAFDGLISKITNGVGGALSSVFGNAAGGLAGNIPGVSSIPGVGTPSAPGGGGVGGAASSILGAGNPINVVSGVVSAVSGVIGNFQFAAMNKSLDLIETEARKIKNILGGDDQESGISLKLRMIENGVWYGPGVKAVEDFRNKFWDTSVPALQAIEAHGAYIQPTLDHFGSEYFSQWGSKFDAIVRNTERTARGVEALSGSASLGYGPEQLINDIEFNREGLATAILNIPRTR